MGKNKTKKEERGTGKSGMGRRIIWRAGTSRVGGEERIMGIENLKRESKGRKGRQNTGEYVRPRVLEQAKTEEKKYGQLPRLAGKQNKAKRLTTKSARISLPAVVLTVVMSLASLAESEEEEAGEEREDKSTRSSLGAWRTRKKGEKMGISVKEGRSRI
jgi:hypothetical protein